MEITKDIKYVGVNDYDIELFEGLYGIALIIEKSHIYSGRGTC